MPCDGPCHAMAMPCAMPLSHEGSGTAALSKKKGGGGVVKGVFYCVIAGFYLTRFTLYPVHFIKIQKF